MKKPNPMWRCPDGGYCHHECTSNCFRVLACGPLSDVFPGDDWPEEVVRAHVASSADPALWTHRLVDADG